MTRLKYKLNHYHSCLFISGIIPGTRTPPIITGKNTEIRPNLTYSVSRGLVTGLAVPKAPHLIMPCTKSTLHPLPTPQNNEPVPQALKQVVNLSCFQCKCNWGQFMSFYPKYSNSSISSLQYSIPCYKALDYENEKKEQGILWWRLLYLAQT